MSRHTHTHTTHKGFLTDLPIGKHMMDRDEGNHEGPVRYLIKCFFSLENLRLARLSVIKGIKR